MKCLFKDSCNFFIVIASILDFRIINNNGLSMCVFQEFYGHDIVFFSFTFLKVDSEEIGSSPCKCSPLLSLTFVEIKESYT